MNEQNSTAADISNIKLLREKSAHIVKAARSATLANILAPLLCIPMFGDQVSAINLYGWLGYMAAVVMIRTWIVFQLEHDAEKIEHPNADLRNMTFAVGIVGIGWGLGWPLLTPSLDMVNRMIYVYMTTAAMIASMFAYSVNLKTFYAFTLPIIVPALSTVLWPIHIFPWPFSVGLASLYLVVLGISKSFAKIFEEASRQRFRSESLNDELNNERQIIANERDQSIAANVAKSKFIAVASHDLRQPLHAVNVNLDLVRLRNLDKNEYIIFERIKSSISTLNAMFDSLLDMSKLDAHATRVENEDIVLLTLVDSIRGIVQPRANAKKLDLNFNAPNYVLRGDRLVLQQILVNLILNAIQYTSAGSIEVQFHQERGNLMFTVTDTGAGISSQDQMYIFNEFYRVDQTRGFHDGLGLGLTIVKRLCHLIGASISVKSELSRGSSFYVVTKCPVMLEEHDHPLVQEWQSPSSETLNNSLAGKCIAIIENDDVILNAYRETFSARGAQIQVLSEYDEELELQMAGIDKIDCILSDFRLNQTSGDLLISKIRESYNWAIPAVIVTADTSAKHIHLFAELGVPVLHKPVSFQKIIDAIEKVCLEQQLQG